MNGVYVVEIEELKASILKLLKEDEEFRYAVAGLVGLEEILKRLDKHEVELVKLRKDLVKLRKDLVKLRKDLVKLREDMLRGFELIDKRISALGARWGIMIEEAFREGLRGLVEREFGFRVERWRGYDDSGRVYGYPSDIEVDIAIKDERIILIEISSHIRSSDIIQFKRKAEIYYEKTGRKPDRLLIITPYIEEKALEASKKLGIEVYTRL
ncbi:MAG: DUF3782 domain-containing protein [Candidatus Methanomethylicia archaeon]